MVQHSYSDESPLIPNEFLNEPHITAQDLGGEPILGFMLENEPDLWIHAVPSNIKRTLKEKQVKDIEFNTFHSLISNLNNSIDTDLLRFFFSSYLYLKLNSTLNDKNVFMSSS